MKKIVQRVQIDALIEVEVDDDWDDDAEDERLYDRSCEQVRSCINKKLTAGNVFLQFNVEDRFLVDEEITPYYLYENDK